MSPFVQDERTALHEACRSQSEAQGDLAKVTQLLIDAGSDVNSKASDAGEVGCYMSLSVFSRFICVRDHWRCVSKGILQSVRDSHRLLTSE